VVGDNAVDDGPDGQFGDRETVFDDRRRSVHRGRHEDRRTDRGRTDVQADRLATTVDQPNAVDADGTLPHRDSRTSTDPDRPRSCERDVTYPRVEQACELPVPWATWSLSAGNRET
jgi:hypothetical protein